LARKYGASTVNQMKIERVGGGANDAQANH
jgi:hypothetical protein